MLCSNSVATSRCLVGGADCHVHYEQDHVGLLDGAARLGRDQFVELLAPGLPPSSVDQGEVAPGPVGLEDLAVAGHTRVLLHDGLATPDDPVDER